MYFDLVCATPPGGNLMILLAKSADTSSEELKSWSSTEFLRENPFIVMLICYNKNWVCGLAAVEHSPIRFLVNVVRGVTLWWWNHFVSGWLVSKRRQNCALRKTIFISVRGNFCDVKMTFRFKKKRLVIWVGYLLKSTLLNCNHKFGKTTSKLILAKNKLFYLQKCFVYKLNVANHSF